MFISVDELTEYQINTLHTNEYHSTLNDYDWPIMTNDEICNKHRLGNFNKGDTFSCSEYIYIYIYIYI